MDLSMSYPTFFRNFKFWGIHTLVNSIPSIILAYLHDWNTVESFIAMGIGIILFAFMLAFFMSMKDVHRICTTGFISQAIKAGTYFRLFLFILGLPVILAFLFYLIGGNDSVDKFGEASGMLWMPDLIKGIISHGFYNSLRNVIPIRGIHEFIPTVIMTLIQGTLLMGMLITSGVGLAGIGLVFRKNIMPKHA
jgi:hypothetical protein